MTQQTKWYKSHAVLIAVAALGYFVDIYDLILFSIVRKQSLLSIGVSEQDLLSVGIDLINYQMFGMLVGGLVWGILGDKRGRLSVLFGSIFLYSAANIANGFVTDTQTYAWLRFIAGIGLAGELGAGITLVAESMTKETRGYGTMVVVSFGVLGAVLAGVVGKNFDWTTAYFIGGVMGLALLVLRMGVFESGMYHKVKESKVKRGSFMQLFTNRKRFIRYLCCITIGLPIWYLIGVLIFLSPEFAHELGIKNIESGSAVLFFYLGTSVGDFMSGYLSQLFKNRKNIVKFYLISIIITVPVYLFSKEISANVFYFICALLGFAAGYWAVFVTIASEQFGTNLRSTVTTTVPNFVRGGLVLLTLGFELFHKTLQFTMVSSALWVGAITVSIAFISLTGLHETFGKELDYFELD
ncbi:MAG TPA: MFS transporter [Bacteroidia bacterium]|nr:MFS transporter [Bacteroidia bacterium]HRH09222.1 MFS transporter [Bacteroidia bacterium]HRH63793.1 MFS transporter [Bacteroidia bacterium]